MIGNLHVIISEQLIPHILPPVVPSFPLASVILVLCLAVVVVILIRRREQKRMSPWNWTMLMISYAHVVGYHYIGCHRHRNTVIDVSEFGDDEGHDNDD